MTSAYSRPEVQKIRSAARSEAVFNVNQTSLGATHQVCPTHNDASLKDSAEIPTLIHLHYCLPRPRHFTMTDWALEHDFSAHPSQVGRLQAGGSSSHSGSGLAPEAGR